MKKALRLTLCAVALGIAAFAQAQPRGRVQEPPKDGLKDHYKDYFSVGVAVNLTNVSDPDQIALIKREFNSITAENAMKPQPTEPQKGVYNWEDADKIADFCRQNGI